MYKLFGHEWTVGHGSMVWSPLNYLVMGEWLGHGLVTSEQLQLNGLDMDEQFLVTGDQFSYG